MGPPGSHEEPWRQLPLRLDQRMSTAHWMPLFASGERLGPQLGVPTPDQEAGFTLMAGGGSLSVNWGWMPKPVLCNVEAGLAYEDCIETFIFSI